MKIEIFIIIVTYNGMKWLSKCLESCESFNVIVVDNNSNDETISFVKKNFTEVTILQQEKNLGFGAANNIGISYALKQGAEFMFLLNQDAYLEKKTISNLINAYKSNTNYGILSPIHLNGDGIKLDNNFSKYIKFNDILEEDINEKLYSKQIYELPFVNAAAWLLPKKTIQMVGGFDPIFHHYGEDVNYCQRVLYHKFTIGVVSESYVLHDRELRQKRILKNRIEKISHFERSLKQSFGNINIEIEDNVRLKKQIVVKIILKSILTLNLKEVIFNIDKYKRLNTILVDIIQSRVINKKTGLHYLDN